MHFQLRGHFSGNGQGVWLTTRRTRWHRGGDKGIETGHDSPPNVLFCVPNKGCRTNVCLYVMQAV